MAEAKKKGAGSSELLETIKSMSVMELYELVKALEEEFDVSATAPIATMTAVSPGGGESAAEVEVKSEVSVILNVVGDAKDRIQVIKVVRSITDLGLKEAKDLVDSLPAPIKEGITPEEAETIKKKLEDAGAGVVIK